MRTMVTWLASRIAAGEVPDIAWDQFSQSQSQHGFLVDGAGRIPGNAEPLYS